MRYAVLHHSGAEGGDHFDFLVEKTAGTGDLLTWRLPGWPVAKGGEAVEVKRLKDHRRIYLTYEGEISSGRGVVVRVDEGDAEMDFPGGHIEVTLPGERVLEFHAMEDDRWFLRGR